MSRAFLLAAALGVASATLATSVQALDTAPASPSAQVSVTIPAPAPDQSAKQQQADRFSTTRPIAGNPGYVVITPAWRRHSDRNSDPEPWSNGDTDSDGVPNSRDHKPADPTRH